MTVMSRELYEALKAANVPEDKAVQAAEAVAGALDAPRRLDKLEAALTALERRLAAVEAKLLLVQWMLGLNLAATVAVLWRLLR